MSLARHVEINQSLENIFKSDRSDIKKSYDILMLFFQAKLRHAAPQQYAELYFQFHSSAAYLTLIEQYLEPFKNTVFIGCSYSLTNGIKDKCDIGITINSVMIFELIQQVRQKDITQAEKDTRKEEDQIRASRYYELFFNRSNNERTELANPLPESPEPSF
jgi:hypothetical protein